MRDPNRIPEILAEVERVWKLEPDMRLGQLIANIVTCGAKERIRTNSDLAREIMLMEEPQLISGLTVFEQRRIRALSRQEE